MTTEYNIEWQPNNAQNIIRLTLVPADIQSNFTPWGTYTSDFCITSYKIINNKFKNNKYKNINKKSAQYIQM